MEAIPAVPKKLILKPKNPKIQKSKNPKTTP
jgi:hypothetical protein